MLAKIGSISPFHALTASAAVSRSLILAIGGATLFLGIGCQSTVPGNLSDASSVSGTASKPATSGALLAAQPRPIIVQDFAFDVAQSPTDQGVMASGEGRARRVSGSRHPEEKPAEKATRLASLLSETIAKGLTDLKIPATRAPRESALPADGFVVGGEFLEIDEGNRRKRAVVGFGAGSTEVLVQVAVYDLAQSREQPILVYGTGSGSKPMPGAVVSMNPYAMGVKYVMSRNATEKDVRNLGKQIAKDLAQLQASGAPKQ